MNGSTPIFRELLSLSGSEPDDVPDMVVFFASMQWQERRKGGRVSLRSADTHKLLRYHRNGIALLLRAVRQGYIRLDRKITKRTQRLLACDK